MARACCTNCVYAVCDPELWLRWQYMGLPLVPQCANHPWLPGQLQEVTGTPCCNYRAKPTTPTGAVRLIPLTDGSYVYVEAADYEWLGQYKWHLENGYAARKEKGRTILMHRAIMQPPPGMVVDHIDGSQANNCRFNLRVCTRAENQRNRRKHTGAASSYKGVFYNKRRRKWFSQIWVAGKGRATPCVDEEAEAARAYDRQAVEHFGEFARLNFPEEWPPERRAEIQAAKPEGEKVRGSEGKRGRSAKPRATSDGKTRPRKKEKRQPSSGRRSGRQPRSA